MSALTAFRLRKVHWRMQLAATADRRASNGANDVGDTDRGGFGTRWVGVMATKCLESHACFQ